MRQAEAETVLVLLNISPNRQAFTLPDGNWRTLIGGSAGSAIEKSVMIEPWGLFIGGS